MQEAKQEPNIIITDECVMVGVSEVLTGVVSCIIVHILMRCKVSKKFLKMQARSELFFVTLQHETCLHTYTVLQA